MYPEVLAGTIAGILEKNESPTNAPHSSGQKRQNVRIPHILGTQRAANIVIKPHLSPTCPGVGEGGSGFTLTGALPSVFLTQLKGVASRIGILNS